MVNFAYDKYDLDAAAQTKTRTSRTTLLSPFDSLVWHRERTERLFGLRFQLEAYVPQHRREHGYFTMPVLHRGELVARVDPKREKGVLHARTLRQPCRGAILASLDEAAIRKVALKNHKRGELQFVREANFVAFVSPVEAVAQAAAAAAPLHARWNNVRPLTPAQQEAQWLKGQPAEITLKQWYDGSTPAMASILDISHVALELAEARATAKAGDAGAKNEDARGLDRAGSRHQHRHVAVVGFGGDDDRLVAGDVSL